MRSLRCMTFGMIFWWAAVLAACAMSNEQEVKIGREAALQIEREYRITSNREWQAQIEEIGQKLVTVCSRRDIEYHFKVLDMGNEMNAFALPGGFVYFSERLWKPLSIDQRAAVLAHELAHVTQRHWARRVDKETKKSIALVLLDLILQPNRDIARVMGTASDLMSLHYSRGDERDADEKGLQYLYSAGYNPWGYVSAMQQLRQLAGDFPREIKFLSTHPLTAERIKAAEERVEKLNVPRPQPVEPSKPKITRMPEEEKPVIEVNDFQASGDYGGTGAEAGVADLFAQELARSGQAYVTRSGQLVASAARNRLESIPVDLSSRHRLTLTGLATYTIKEGKLSDPGGKATMTVHLRWSLSEGDKEIRQGEKTYTRTDAPGSTAAKPWVNNGLYDKGAIQFLAGRTSLNAVRLALQDMVAYPDLLPTVPITEVNSRARSVTLDIRPDSVSPGDRYKVMKPLGDYIVDLSGSFDERAIVKVAELEVTEVSEKGVIARVTMEKGYRMNHLKPGDPAIVTE